MENCAIITKVVMEFKYSFNNSHFIKDNLGMIKKLAYFKYKSMGKSITENLRKKYTMEEAN